ncbi:MAG TPA: signal peptidase I [Patescibacteria group bacterium]|nr:signal peptidase I [Patescibacteria group bacterium]
MSYSFEKSSSESPQPHDESGQGAWASVWLFVWDFLKVFLIALAIIIPIRFYLFQPFIVTGLSMQPNFHDGEYLIIDEISYRLTQPKRGDVAVIRSPADNSQFFIKRIIGLPGETVEISGGKVVIINTEHPRGTILTEDYIPSAAATFGSLKIQLSTDQFYVLGDNRLASSDSRSFGPINRSKIIGRVLLRAFPLNKFATFSAPNYAY